MRGYGVPRQSFAAVQDRRHLPQSSRDAVCKFLPHLIYAKGPTGQHGTEYMLTDIPTQAIDEAIVFLKRNRQWRLRDGDRLPELLSPAHFMLEEELQEIFSRGEKQSEWFIVQTLIERLHHKAAVVRVRRGGNEENSALPVPADLRSSVP